MCKETFVSSVCNVSNNILYGDSSACISLCRLKRKIKVVLKNESYLHALFALLLFHTALTDNAKNTYLQKPLCEHVLKLPRSTDATYPRSPRNQSHFMLPCNTHT